MSAEQTSRCHRVWYVEIVNILRYLCLYNLFILKTSNPMYEVNILGIMVVQSVYFEDFLHLIMKIVNILRYLWLWNWFLLKTSYI